MITSLIWNARGVGNKATVRRLKKLSHGFSLSFLVIIEPFIDSSMAVSLCATLKFDDCLFSESNKI